MCFNHTKMLDISFHRQMSKYLLALLRILIFFKQYIYMYLSLFHFILFYFAIYINLDFTSSFTSITLVIFHRPVRRSIYFLYRF